MGKKVIQLLRIPCSKVQSASCNPNQQHSNKKKDDNSCLNAIFQPLNHEAETSGIYSVMNVKKLLKIAESDVFYTDCFRQVSVPCKSTYCHSRISEKLAEGLKLQCLPTILTVRGDNYQQTINTQLVEFSLTTVHLDDSHATFSVKPYVRKDLNIGTGIIDVLKFKQQYPYLEPVTFSKDSYVNVGIILGKEPFHLIPPPECSESDRQDTPDAILLPLGWVLCESFGLTSGPMFTCFKAHVRPDNDCELADQLR